MFTTRFTIYLLALIGCLVNSAVCKLQPITDAEDTVPQATTVNCVLTISEQAFPAGESISIATANQQADILTRLVHTRHKWTLLVQTVNGVSLFDGLTKTDNYIIPFNGIDDLKTILVCLKTSPGWNPFARFLVTSGNARVSAANITELVWTYRLQNVVIVLPSSERSLHVLDMYSWYPYADGNCADNFSNIHVVNQCKHGELLNAGVSLFPDRIPNDLNGCDIRVRPVLVQPFTILPRNLNRTETNLNLREGIDIKLVNTIAAAANFTVNYTITPRILDWGTLVENGTTVVADGLMKALLDREVDIGIGYIAGTAMRNKYLDYTVPYMQDSHAWCVPRALPTSKWKCLFAIFQLATWTLTLVTLVLAALCQWALSYNRPLEIPSYRDVRSCTSNTLATMLGVAVATQPRTGHNRMFFIIWIVFSMHLTISYQSSLISVLTLPSYDKQIATLDDVFDAKLSFGFASQAVRFYENQDDWRSRKVTAEWTRCKGAVSCLKAVAYARNYTFGYFRLALRYHESSYLDADGKPLVYIFRDDIVVFSLIMQLSRGFPLTNRLNTLIYRVKEAGLTMYWFEQLLDKRKKKINTSTKSVTQLKLHLFHLQGAFLICGCGLVLATVVFGLELVIHKWKQTRV